MSVAIPRLVKAMDVKPNPDGRKNRLREAILSARGAMNHLEKVIDEVFPDFDEKTLHDDRINDKNQDS